MNIGFVTQDLPYLPSAGGFRLYAANLIRCLSRRHSIHLVSLVREDDSEHTAWSREFCQSLSLVPLREYSALARGLNVTSGYLRGKLINGHTRLLQAVHQSASANKWDIMHVEGSTAGSMISDFRALPKLLSIHDSGTLRCQEMLKCAQSYRERVYHSWLQHYQPRFERLLFPRFETITVVAQADLEEVRRVVANQDVRLIPNGTDTEYFRPVPIEKDSFSIAFHSHLGYPPNIEAALEFANEVLPRIRRKIPNAVFHLIGARPSQRILELASRPDIEISADVPDIPPLVCSAQVYACPIRFGTGIKNKMLEAMAMQMPIVAYPGATVGLGCTHNRNVMEASTPDEFARFTIELLENPQRAGDLARNARHFAEERFSWDSRAHAYEELYREILSRYQKRMAITEKQRPQANVRNQLNA